MIELKAGTIQTLFIQFSLSRGTPWTRLTSSTLFANDNPRLLTSTFSYDEVNVES